MVKRYRLMSVTVTLIIYYCFDFVKEKTLRLAFVRAAIRIYVQHAKVLLQLNGPTR